jgi:hypothetical protein
MVSEVGYWVYVFANIGVVSLCGLLGGLSLLAYYREPESRSYAIASFGFFTILLGGMTEIVYTVFVAVAFTLSANQFLFLQAGEDILITLGLGLLFYAITQHSPTSLQEDTSVQLDASNDHWVTGRFDDD